MRLPAAGDKSQFCLFNFFLNLPFINSVNISNFLPVHDIKKCNGRKGIAPSRY